METLPNWKLQKLINLKNKLKDESEEDYSQASIESDPVEEVKYLESSRIKLKISNQINAISYE